VKKAVEHKTVADLRRIVRSKKVKKSDTLMYSASEYWSYSKAARTCCSSSSLVQAVILQMSYCSLSLM